MRIESIVKPLSLKNSGELEVVFIGVGNMFAKEHGHTNFLLIKGDVHVMVDFGRTAPEKLTQVTGLDLPDIEVVLPTHSHSDHIGGLEQLAFANRYIGQKFMGKKKLQMIVTPEYERVLWDHSLRGGLAYSEDGPLGLRDFFDVIRPQWKSQSPREQFAVDIGDLHIELFRTNHIPDSSVNWQHAFISYGLFVDEHVFLSVDTKFDLDLLNTYETRSTVFFHDVQFFSGAVHAPLEDLKTLPGFVKERMYLKHYADNWNKQDIAGFAGWAQEGVRYIFE